MRIVQGSDDRQDIPGIANGLKCHRTELPRTIIIHQSKSSKNKHMKKNSTSFLQETRKYKVYAILALLLVGSVYILSVLLNKDLVYRLNYEDGLFESLTAISFLLTAVVFSIYFVRTKKIINLLIALIFVFGAGEEISWGQRIFNYETPESIAEINTQKEFNLHNLKMTSSFDENGIKQGISRYFKFEVAWILFCLFYGILLPIAYRHLKFVERLVDRLGVPVPPLIVGLFFIVNYVTYKIIGNVDALAYRSQEFHSTIDESFEATAAMIFLIIAISLLQDLRERNRKVA